MACNLPDIIEDHHHHHHHPNELHEYPHPPHHHSEHDHEHHHPSDFEGVSNSKVFFFLNNIVFRF